MNTTDILERDMNKYEVEVTDTFRGEANYCWVRRYQIEGDTEQQLVRRAKEEAGWNGLRCKTSFFGDMIVVRPQEMRQVMFITRIPSARGVGARDAVLHREEGITVKRGEQA